MQCEKVTLVMVNLNSQTLVALYDVLDLERESGPVEGSSDGLVDSRRCVPAVCEPTNVSSLPLRPQVHFL